MKTIKVITTAGLACLLAIGSVSVNATDINNAVTTVRVSTGLDTNGDGFFAGTSHGVSVGLDENGKKTRTVSTSVSQSEFLPWDETSLCFDHPSGLDGAKLFYLFSTGVSRVKNGDQLYVELDTDSNFESYWCGRTDSTENNVVLNRIIIGGTGRYENACGYVRFVGIGTTVGETVATGEGVSTGEVFDSTTVAPGTVHGCP